jgi:hypothetical protein
MRRASAKRTRSRAAGPSVGCVLLRRTKDGVGLYFRRRSPRSSRSNFSALDQTSFRRYILSSVMGSEDHEARCSQTPTLRDLHPQIDRAQSRSRTMPKGKPARPISRAKRMKAGASFRTAMRWRPLGSLWRATSHVFAHSAGLRVKVPFVTQGRPLRSARNSTRPMGMRMVTARNNRAMLMMACPATR